MKTLLLLALSAPVLLGALVRSAEASAVQGVGNLPPVCCFGPDCQQTGLIATVPCTGNETTYQLDASQSYDPEGMPLTFFWQSSPGSTIDDPTAPITTLRIDTSMNCDQTVAVRLFVSDGRNSSYCRLHVDVVPPNRPPVCCFGPDCQQTGLIATLNCTGSETTYTLDASQSYDPEGQPLTFFWQSCPGSTIDDPTAPITTLRIDTSSTCTISCPVRLFVSDGIDSSYCRLFVNVVPGAGEGCTPGYWKNHTESWGPTGFKPSDDFDTVFGVDAFSPDKTLLQALQSGGGGLNKLGRHGTAALLNASHGINFPLTQAEVLDAVHDAIVSGNYEPTASNLAKMNELGCPLN